MTLSEEFEWYYKNCNQDVLNLKDCRQRFASEDYLVISGDEASTFIVKNTVRRLGFSFYSSEVIVFVIATPSTNELLERLAEYIQNKYPKLIVQAKRDSGLDSNNLYLKLAITGTMSGKITTSNYREKLLNGTLAEEW